MSFCLSYPKLLDSPIVQVAGVADWRAGAEPHFLKEKTLGDALFL